MGDLQIEGNGFIELGKEYEVMIRFPLVQRIERFMNKGRKWWIHEASRQLGEAEIIEFEMPKGEQKNKNEDRTKHPTVINVDAGAFQKQSPKMTHRAHEQNQPSFNNVNSNHYRNNWIDCRSVSDS